MRRKEVFVIGLGNPGNAASIDSRHNVGQLAVGRALAIYGDLRPPGSESHRDRIQNEDIKLKLRRAPMSVKDTSILKFGENRRSYKYYRSTVLLYGMTINFIEPVNVYMNSSGRFIRALRLDTDEFLENLLIIHDDIDLPIGRVRFRTGGGDGGHNGIKNIRVNLGDDFSRLKVGVGRPTDDTVEQYLTREMSLKHRKHINKVIDTILKKCMLDWALYGTAHCSVKYNKLFVNGSGNVTTWKKHQKELEELVRKEV